MGRPRLADIEEATPERILEAAGAEFGRRGYEAARLADIAAEAGIRRASLLHHFPSKEALYEAAVRRAFEALERTLERAALTEGDFRARLRAVIEALIAFEREHLPMLAVILRDVLGEGARARASVVDSFGPLVDRLESVARLSAGDAIAPAFPLRAALLQLIVAHLVRSAMGDAGAALWKGDAHTWTLAETLLLDGRAGGESKEGEGR